MDEILDSEVTVKATGYQWYWQYSYGDYSTDNEGITFDSFTLADSDLELGSPRKLTTDTSLVLPVNTSIRMIITANDVIHSFGVPSLGVKCDAIPGRLNSVGFIINRPGNIYGMCSELCGSAHSMMNISISAVSLPEYIEFIRSNLNHNYVLKSVI
jgi:heme/copper-type cytochrome/quinol oxidase subunit 2